ncbi:ribosomal protection-like ABC-F family protein [Cytobacillus sp. FJAT-54145]|uniref:Ribosomal protection-like ABC-F family protein n=1 Tax=Cytobacillus spartinae TaxID=3299023 RepID=A0ABW6K9W8_9BACI
MTMMKVIGIHKSFGDKEILKDIKFTINANERIGIVGYNGSGKTTLANILFGKIGFDKGVIETPNGSLKIGYLLQSVDYTVNDFQQVYTDLENHELLIHTSQLGLGNISKWNPSRAEHLSGGEKLKLSLAKVWATKPDMLILDEPTNHLDFKGLNWLVSQLKSFDGPVLIISHDRSFLDQTVNRIFEIEDRELVQYSGNYTEYREEKKKRREVQEHQYTNQQRYKAKIEQQMENLSRWSDKAHRESTKQDGFKEYFRVKAKKMDIQVKSKLKRLEQELEKNKIDKPKEDTKILFQFDSSGKRGKRVIEASGIGKNYGNNTLFTDSNFYIKYGERVGIIGENGAGKTTFIRLLLGEEELTKGELWKSESLKIAYLSQDVHDLPGDMSAIDSLQLSHQSEIFRARTIFANLGLKQDKIIQKVNSLSLGERIRVKLTDILMKNYDLLILDEPTNHLDLPSREQLEETLSEFTGTILTVSHDRYFLERLSDKLLIFENKQIKRFEKGLKQYLGTEKSKKSRDSHKEEELMVINNQITAILGELSFLTPGEEKYLELDHQFKQLMEMKKQLLG